MIPSQTFLNEVQISNEKASALDRWPWLPILVLMLLPFAVHLPLWVLGLSTDPMWFYSGISEGSRLLPGHPFLDPNVGYTSEALGHLAAWDWVHGIVPWWNSYTGVGMPLAGELQPEAFFLPFNLLLLLPEGILWQQIVMQIIAGLATYALLRELKLSRLAALMGGALFALNGTLAWTPGPASVYCSLPFLPLLLWGIERARKPQGGAASILAIGSAIAWSILAGFPEPAYISGLMALAWGFYRLVYEQRRWVIARRAIFGWLLGMMVAAPLLISFVDYLLQSNSFGNHPLGERSLPWAAFSTILMPYVYGPMTSAYGSQTLTDIWGNIGGYTGVLILLMAIAGLTFRPTERGLRALLLIWTLVAWAKSFGVQWIMVILNHVPLLRQAIFFRYSPPSWELALIILAAFALDDLRTHAAPTRRSFGFALAAICAAVALALPRRAFWHWPHAQIPIMSVFLLISVCWSLASLLIAGLAWKLLSGHLRRLTLASLLVLDAAAMFLSAQSSAVRNNRVDMQAVRFLKDHLDLSRTYTLGPLQPNYGAFFQVPSINHNVLPGPRLWNDYVGRNLLPGFEEVDLGVTFYSEVMSEGAGQQALSQHLDSYQNLGVRYVLTTPDQSPMSTTFLPAPDTKMLQAGTKPFVLATSGPASRLLGWAHLVIDDPAKPAILRYFARWIVHAIGSQAPSAASSGPAPGAVLASGTGQLLSGSSDLILRSSESVSVDLILPKTSPSADPITTVGVLIGNYGGTADGELAVELCDGSICQSGQKALAGSLDNANFQIVLEHPLPVSGGPLHLRLTHLGGSQAVALRTAGETLGVERNLRGPTGAFSERTLHLALVHGLSLRGIKKVYADSVMEIWELPRSCILFRDC
jgi:hypothetical protein